MRSVRRGLQSVPKHERDGIVVLVVELTASGRESVDGDSLRSRRGISMKRLIRRAIPSEAMLLHPPISKPANNIVDISIPSSPATVNGPGVGGISE